MLSVVVSWVPNIISFNCGGAVCHWSLIIIYSHTIAVAFAFAVIYLPPVYYDHDTIYCTQYDNNNNNNSIINSPSQSPNQPTHQQNISLYPLYLWLCSLSACAYSLPRLFPSVHPPTASQSASVVRLVVQVVICTSQFTQINTQNWSNDDPDIIEIRKW